MPSILGLEFAPLWIPLERRLQTLAVFHYTSAFLFLGLGCLALMIYMLFTPLYPIPLLYTVWYIYDFKVIERGGRRFNFVRNWKLWKYMRDYFPIRLIRTAELRPDRNYLICLHPHGIMAHGPFTNFATEATGFSTKFPGLKPFFTTIRYQFLFPLHREYVMCTGACSCSQTSLDYILQNEGVGNAVTLVVGGAYESLEARPGDLTLNLRKRKGFIRLALKHGASLVPSFSFGENDIYDQALNPPGSALRKFQIETTRWLGFASPLFFGRGIFNYSFGLMPHRRPITCIVGAPISVPQMTEPSDADINELHAKYVHELEALFEEHKKDYGHSEDEHLHII